MKLTESDLTRLHDVAINAAKRAGSHIQVKVGHRESNTKEGGNTLASQVVTEVDLESDALILGVLRESIEQYELGILTEESEDDSSRFDSDYFWCIDPLDGTLSFIEQTPGYSVSIALVSRQGKAVLGVVHDPVAEETFHAVVGRGAFKNGETIPETDSQKSGPLTWLMDRSMKSLEDFPSIFSAMEDIAEYHGCTELVTIDHAGAALNGVWVTQHSPAVYFKLPKKSKGGGSLWDFAASACLLEHWGQTVTDVYGDPLDLNKTGSTFMNERGVIYASDSGLRDSVQKLHVRFQKS